MIIIDADRQFVFKALKHYAENMNIVMKSVFVETHHSIEMMKRYHDSLESVYIIIVAEISDIDSDFVLQIIFKIINDFVDSNNLVLILLVFDVYSRMIEFDVSSSTITQRFMIMKKAMKDVRQLHARRQINDALNTRNKSFITLIHDLLINFLILVYKEENIDKFES
jgi:hypothetical protein